MTLRVRVRAPALAAAPARQQVLQLLVEYPMVSNRERYINTRVRNVRTPVVQGVCVPMERGISCVFARALCACLWLHCSW